MKSITEDAVRSALQNPAVQVFAFDEIDSTNNFVKKLLTSEKMTTPVFAVTGRQSAGRGRLGHTFFSPEGGLYMTLSIMPENEMLSMQMMTVAAAVAAVEAIEMTTGIRCGVKWVNDIYYRERKLAGILCEAPRRADGTLAGIVCGIGINVYQKEFPEELKNIAISLGDPETDRNVLAANFVKRLLYWSGHLESKELMDAYREYSFLIGRSVRFKRDGREIEGIVSGIRDDGNLMIAVDQGETVSLNSGEISLSDWERK
ncbi:MAG: biotin--[acetyl-CoA-carboxylase] ligase [Lachnospiraceae bacterium]|nr:biotin--[acetyl-CoA-carboxylase] ligase [Lachnospiraceae bacterium]